MVKPWSYNAVVKAGRVINKLSQGWGIDTAVLKSLPGAERVLQNYAVILRLDTDCSYPTLAEASSVPPEPYTLNLLLLILTGSESTDEAPNPPTFTKHRALMHQNLWDTTPGVLSLGIQPPKHPSALQVFSCLPEGDQGGAKEAFIR